MSRTCTAVAHPNIALVKYWGKRDLALNLPAVPSLSVTLDGFTTRTTVTWGASRDEVTLQRRPPAPQARERVLRFLDRLAPDGRPPCRVWSENDFPTAAGLASSSSGFAALAVAASRAAGLSLSPGALGALTRQGSGSACRSLYGGFVEWRLGERADGLDSFAAPVAPREHWDLRVVVAVVDAGPKPVGSSAGMLRTAATSPCYPAFVQAAPGLLDRARHAVLQRNGPELFRVMEASTRLMQASMFTSEPAIIYWKPASIAVQHAVMRLREAGVSCGWTMDAGPNVKVVCGADVAHEVARRLEPLVERVHVLGIGGGPHLVAEA